MTGPRRTAARRLAVLAAALALTPGGTPLTPAGGSAAAATDVPAEIAPLHAELQRFGVGRGDYTTTRDGGRYLFQARVPIGNGAVRGYTGAGATEADAVRQVLEQ